MYAHDSHIQIPPLGSKTNTCTCTVVYTTGKVKSQGNLHESIYNNTFSKVVITYWFDISRDNQSRWRDVLLLPLSPLVDTGRGRVLQLLGVAG